MHQMLQAAGDPIPKGSELIEVHVMELKQLFNAMDASPFRERDLDPGAEDLIVGWAREAPRGATLALQVALDRAPGLAEEAEALRDAVHEFFRHRAQVTRRHLRQLLRIGRTSLMVGLVFLALAVTLGGVIAGAMKAGRFGELLRQGLVICGWVAMWRPLEILLYGWWPIRTEARLYDRLSEIPVRIEYGGTAKPDAWLQDWPAMPPAPMIPQKLPPRVTSQKGADDASDAPIAVSERGPIAAATIDAGTSTEGQKV